MRARDRAAALDMLLDEVADLRERIAALESRANLSAPAPASSTFEQGDAPRASIDLHRSDVEHAVDGPQATSTDVDESSRMVPPAAEDAPKPAPPPKKTAAKKAGAPAAEKE